MKGRNEKTQNQMSLAKAVTLQEQWSDIASWQTSLQAAAVNSITAEDVQQIVARQLERAKEGDQNAVRFVMGTLLGSQRPIVVKNTLQVTPEVGARLARQAGE
jgi:membrane protease subunit (stomatin/prohibitin family)